MVQLKYFGDDRDYFKYDLISYVLKAIPFDSYVFIPMLTEHRDDGEGQLGPSSNRADRDQELLEFIRGCRKKSLSNWEKWIAKFVKQYLTAEPVDEIYFHDETREEYWGKYARFLARENALVFVDPDIGIETGSVSYQRKMGRDKYLLNSELTHLVQSLPRSSVLVIYQHLSRNRKHHDEGVMKKIRQASKCASGAHVCAYRENDLAFLFITKSEELGSKLLGVLKRYRQKSECKHNALYSGAGDKKSCEEDLSESAAVETPPRAEEHEPKQSAMPEREARKYRKRFLSTRDWRGLIWLYLILLPGVGVFINYLLDRLFGITNLLPPGSDERAFAFLLFLGGSAAYLAHKYVRSKAMDYYLQLFGESDGGVGMMETPAVFNKLLPLLKRVRRKQRLSDSDLVKLEDATRSLGARFELDESSLAFRYHQCWLIENNQYELRPIRPGIQLERGEECFFKCNAAWTQSSKSTASINLGGIVANKFFVALPIRSKTATFEPESQGEFLLTSRRLLFLSKEKVISLRLDKVLKMEAYDDALAVYGQSGKPNFFYMEPLDAKVLVSTIQMFDSR